MKCTVCNQRRAKDKGVHLDEEVLEHPVKDATIVEALQTQLHEVSHCLQNQVMHLRSQLRQQVCGYCTVCAAAALSLASPEHRTFGASLGHSSMSMSPAVVFSTTCTAGHGYDRMSSAIR